MKKNLVFMALHFVIAKSKPQCRIRARTWLNAFAIVYANSLLGTWVYFDFAGYDPCLD
jgi:hypothetical protein